MSDQGQLPNGHREVAVIVVSDEVLGECRSDSVGCLCAALQEIGLQVSKLSVITNRLETLSEEIQLLSKKFAHLLICLDMERTRHNVIFQGLAASFHEELLLNEELLAMAKNFFDEGELVESVLDGSMIPHGAKLLLSFEDEVETLSFPVVSYRNIFVLCFRPKVVKKMCRILSEHFNGSRQRFYSQQVSVKNRDPMIQETLRAWLKVFDRPVSMHCYPVRGNNYCNYRIIISSFDESHTREAAMQLQKLLSEDIVSADSNPLFCATDKLDRYMSRLSTENPTLYEKYQHSLNFIADCLGQYDWNEIVTAFNGGKDCTALLHLLHCVKVRKYGVSDERKLTIFYVQPTFPFKKMDQFVAETTVRYNLNMITFNGCIKEALEKLKNSYPQYKVVFMGSRSSDPGMDQLNEKAATDPTWPPYMRLFPLFHWSYSDVWSFLRDLWLPYCTLYDQGYTSLGNMKDTFKNTSLKVIKPDGNLDFLAAYQLDDPASERYGRNSAKERPEFF